MACPKLVKLKVAEEVCLVERGKTRIQYHQQKRGLFSYIHMGSYRTDKTSEQACIGTVPGT